MDEKYTSMRVPTLVLVVLGCVVLCLGVALVYTYYQYGNTSGNVRVPTMVREALDAVVSVDVEHVQQELNLVEEKYFVRPGEWGSGWISQDLFDVFYHSGEQTPRGYEIARSKHNYLEIILKDAEGNVLWPRVMLLYEQDLLTGKITRYSMGRLQPFSVFDEEYDETW